MRKLLFLLLLLSASFTSCVDYDDAVKAVVIDVQVALPAEFVQGGNLSGHIVTLTRSGQTLTSATDPSGVAHFENLTPDVYTVATSWTLSAADYQTATGRQVQNDDYTVTGSLVAQLIDGSESRIALATNAHAVQSLIIGKVYASGSKDSNNRNYSAGKYIEFFNNSNREIDISGYYFGLLESGSTPAYTLGLTPDYLYLKQLYRFPTGKPIRVAAGGTVLVANSAIDHTANDAPLEHDLSGADFEAKDASGKTVNNPTTPAVELVFSMWAQVTAMNLVQGGPTSVVLFTADDVDAWPQVYAYQKSTGAQYLRMPAKVIKDGVDILKYNTVNGVDLTSRRLYDWIDAGYTHISSASGWNGEVSVRKVSAKAPDGRFTLMDTNNSTNDFTTATHLAPRQYPQ